MRLKRTRQGGVFGVRVLHAHENIAVAVERDDVRAEIGGRPQKVGQTHDDLAQDLGQQHKRHASDEAVEPVEAEDILQAEVAVLALRQVEQDEEPGGADGYDQNEAEDLKSPGVGPAFADQPHAVKRDP